MKHLFSNLLFILVISTFAFGQRFSPCENIGEDECVVYVYRLRSIVGGAVKWPVTTKIFSEDSGKFIESQDFKHGKLNKKEYKAIRLKANTFYWLSIGNDFHSVLFAGTNGSETIIQTKGVKSETAAIKGEALIRTNSESGFKIRKGNFKSWSEAIKNVDSFSSLRVNDELTAYGFEILEANPESKLYEVLKSMSKAKK